MLYKRDVTNDIVLIQIHDLCVLQVNGIKGLTALSVHAPLDLPMAVVIDDLHCLYLGVAKRLIKTWFGKGSRGKDYFIGNKVCLHVHVHVMFN